MNNSDVSKRRISAVLFDWDYTLGRILGDVTPSQRITKLLVNQGIECSTDEVERAIQVRQKRIKAGELIGEVAPQTKNDITQFYQQILSIMQQREVSWSYANHLYYEFGHLPVVMYEDSLPVLKSLKEDGFLLGIISNNTTSARKNIEQNVKGLVSPEHIVISEEIDIHKPAEAIFVYAASQLGLSPGSCIYVGDNLQVDAIGAVQQGGYRYGLWIDRKNTSTKESLPECIFHIGSLFEVIAFVNPKYKPGRKQ